MAKCYSLKDPKWNCDKWAKETPNIKGLPFKKTKAKLKVKSKNKKYGYSKNKSRKGK